MLVAAALLKAAIYCKLKEIVKIYFVRFETKTDKLHPLNITVFRNMDTQIKLHNTTTHCVYKLRVRN